MKTLEDIFVREFKSSVSGVGRKDVYGIPLPPESSSWYVSGVDMFQVRGISGEDEPYNLLEGKVVRRLPQGTVARRRAIDKATRGFLKDASGSYVYEDYSVPAGSIVVVSTENIGVLYKGYRVATKSGYGYIDFVDTVAGREFLYVLPKSVLYEINQTALALSVTNMKNYSGMGYTSWNNGTIYLHIIPYNPRAKYIGSKILATKCGLDYTNELKAILAYWQKAKVIPDLALSLLSSGENLATRPTSVGYEGYVQVQPIALGDKEIYGADNNGETG